MKHTKGPWKTASKETELGIFNEKGDTHIASIQCFGKTDHANAQLIAAAPDLLLAANLVQNAYRNPKLSDPSSPFKDLTMIAQMTALNMLDKAIAKAKGES